MVGDFVCVDLDVVLLRSKESSVLAQLNRVVVKNAMMKSDMLSFIVMINIPFVEEKALLGQRTTHRMSWLLRGGNYPR